MDLAGDSTGTLLRRWHGGDEEALHALLEHNLPFVQQLVRRKLGDRLRWKTETGDVVQEAVLEFLRNGPRFVVSDEHHFRSLLVRVVQNVITGQHRWFTARRREMNLEQPLPSDSVLELDPAVRSVTRPSEAAARSENQALLRLALELLEPEERDLILLRDWDGLSFPEIGERLGVQPNAVRMRYARALPILADQVERLRRGELEPSGGSGE
jgi:RNA polymerase sigma-70 factor (ECF subfamily)